VLGYTRASSLLRNQSKEEKFKQSYDKVCSNVLGQLDKSTDLSKTPPQQLLKYRSANLPGELAFLGLYKAISLGSHDDTVRTAIYL